MTDPPQIVQRTAGECFVELVLRLQKWMGAERDHLRGFEFTYLGLALGVLLLSAVPQVHTVMFEGPDLVAVVGGGLFSLSTVAGMCFYGIHFVLIVGFAVSFLVVPWLLWSEFPNGEGVDQTHLVSDAFRLLPWLIVVFGVSVYEALLGAALISAVFRTTVVFVFGMVWFVVIRMVRAKTPDRNDQVWGSLRPVGLLAVVSLGLALQWGIEQLIPHVDGLVSWRLYAFAGAYHLCAVMVLVGFVADRVMSHAPCRVGFLAALGGTYLALSMLSDGVRPEPRTSPISWQERLDAQLEDGDEPVILVALAGGGTRAAALGMLALESLRTWGYHDRILMISSVSGGSLAAVHYTHGSREWEGNSSYTWKTSFSRDLAGRMGGDVEQTLRWWPFANGNVDAMFTNYDAAILKGMNFPWMSRGDALAGFWTDHLHWDRKEDGPFLLINTTRVDTGSRVTVGFPPVPPGLFDDWGKSGERPYDSFETYAPGLEVDLATAVRMSSAFPWGLDSPWISCDRSFRAIDGGVFDNTGLGTLAAVIAGLPQKSRDTLRRRGVVVVEVDAGGKPVGGGGGLFGPLSDPLTAMSHAAIAREAVLRKHTDAAFRRMLCDGPECDLKSYRMITLSYDPASEACDGLLSEEIPTAWTLGPADVADTLTLYRCLEGGEDRGFRTSLRDDLRSMKSFRNPAAPAATLVNQSAGPASGAGDPVLIRLDSLPADFVELDATGSGGRLRSDIPIRDGSSQPRILKADTRLEFRGIEPDMAQQGVWVQAIVQPIVDPQE